jgi:hypothetical protein
VGDYETLNRAFLTVDEVRDLPWHREWTRLAELAMESTV